VVDIRSLRPLDEETILASVAKTGRVAIVHEAPRTAGIGAEVSSLIHERAMLDLEAPVMRVTGFDVPFPQFANEDDYLPSVDRILGGARKVLDF
jgi:pyruvate/2-oxoglutarate/acetoin dehydrogenase E1 component